ncbi:MAG TPA: aromatase/cyclase [Limnochordia bacterium]
MPFVERSIVARGDKETMYALAKDMESFPQFMPDVEEVRVLERGPNYTITAWKVHIVGRRFEWTERDEFDDARCHITYRQTGGDLKKFEGEWRFEEDGDGGVKITLTVDFDLGMPMLAGMINPVLVKAVQMNSDKMLQAIKQQVEAKARG